MTCMLTPPGPTKRPKVLLLSATPFRIYATQWEESQNPGHTREIFDLVKFLGGALLEAEVRKKFPLFSRALYEFAIASEEQVTESYAGAHAARVGLQQSLTRVMCRTERNASIANQPRVSNDPIAMNGQDFETFRHLARVLGAGTESRHRHEAVAFWSSVPLAAQVLGPSYVGWKAGRRRLRSIAPGPHLKSKEPVRGDQALSAHPKLRELHRVSPPAAASLPWVAPSQRWWPLAKAWEKSDGVSGGPEKMLLFSHFRATPQSIAALASLASEQKAGKRAQSKRRQFNPSADRMAIFALFQPMPWLIRNTDPAPAAGGSLADARNLIRRQLKALLENEKIPVDRDQTRRPFWRVLAGLEARLGSPERLVQAWSTSGIKRRCCKNLREGVAQCSTELTSMSKTGVRPTCGFFVGGSLASWPTEQFTGMTLEFSMTVSVA